MKDFQLNNRAGGEVKEGLTRREFLRRGFSCASGICLLSMMGVPGISFAAGAKKPESSDGNDRFVADARWWDPVAKNNAVKCRLCPHECTVGDGQRGICGVRENRGGKYKTLVHSRPVSLNVDPIEKKPLYHFLPSTKAFSIATAGCNIE